MYSRELNGEVLTFAASGWTYRRTFVLVDNQTESMWYPIHNSGGLTSIAGPHKGSFFPTLAITKSRWSSWVTDHPQTKFWKHWF